MILNVIHTEIPIWETTNKKGPLPFCTKPSNFGELNWQETQVHALIDLNAKNLKLWMIQTNVGIFFWEIFWLQVDKITSFRLILISLCLV